MIILERKPANVIIIISIFLQLSWLEGKKLKEECPIGFTRVSKRGESFCYMLKKLPERFSDKRVECAGRVFTYKEYGDSVVVPDGYTVWTEYRSLYPGGPFVDVGANDDVLENDFRISPTASVHDELCVVSDSESRMTAVRCDETHHRYCVVDTYPPRVVAHSCSRLAGPAPACVWTPGRAGARVTWSRAASMCAKSNATLLARGWRYYNYFNTTDPKPLNIYVDAERGLFRYDDLHTVPPADSLYYEGSVADIEEPFMAIDGSYSWTPVNESFVFTDPICEITFPLKRVNLTLTVSEDEIKLSVEYDDDTELELEPDDIYCFTDSKTYLPSSVTMDSSSSSHEYTLFAEKSGYYWCTHRDTARFQASQSNKVLYVDKGDNLQNTYAVMIHMLSKKYTLKDYGEAVENHWVNRLREYVYYYTDMTRNKNVYEGFGSYGNFTVLNYRKAHNLHIGDKQVFVSKRVKRLYLDGSTALLHLELASDMRPAQYGHWENIYVEYMRPVYYCDSNKKFSLGKSRSAPDCTLYKCVGDFNHGVDTIMEAQEGCRPSTPSVATAAITVTEGTSPAPATLPKPTSATRVEPPYPDDSYSDSSSEEVSPTTEPSEDVTVNITVWKPTTWRPGPWPTTPPPTTVHPVIVVTPSTPEPPTLDPVTLPLTTTDLPITTTASPPQEQLDQVIKELEVLLNNTETFVVEDIDNAFTQVNEFLDVEDLEIPGNLLHLLDDVGSKIDLNGTSDATTVRGNIALLVADAQPELPIKGLRVAAREGDDQFTNNSFEIIRDEINSTQLSPDASEVVVSLPESVTTAHRVSFVVFRTDRAFRGPGLYAVNSRVLSVNIKNITHFPKGETIDIHMMPIEEPMRNQSRTCAFWQFDEDGVSGRWSQEGCTLVRARAGRLDTCRCQHLTHFAEVLVPRTVFTETNESALEILSIVGCSLSILGLLLVGVTAVLFRSWRRDYSNKIWLQLSAAILILTSMFLVVVFVPFYESDALCVVVGVGLHYATLASFCWMLVAAVLSYRRLVLVFSRDASHKLLRAAAFAWGAPCAIVGVLLAVDPKTYGKQFEEKAPSGAFCYPQGLALWLAVYAPIAVMLLANWVLFVLIVRSVFGSRRPQNHGQAATNEAFRCASVSCLLVFLFGLPWVFGLFSFNVVAAYLFTIFVTFQGFVLFLFFVVGNKKTRDLWLNKLRIKRTRKIPVTSSTYTNRSTGAQAPARPSQTPAAIEAKASKPRSLSSTDNSRFS